VEGTGVTRVSRFDRPKKGIAAGNSIWVCPVGGGGPHQGPGWVYREGLFEPQRKGTERRKNRRKMELGTARKNENGLVRTTGDKKIETRNLNLKPRTEGPEIMMTEGKDNVYHLKRGKAENKLRGEGGRRESRRSGNPKGVYGRI